MNSPTEFHFDSRPSSRYEESCLTRRPLRASIGRTEFGCPAGVFGNDRLPQSFLDDLPHESLPIDYCAPLCASRTARGVFEHVFFRPRAGLYDGRAFSAINLLLFLHIAGYISPATSRRLLRGPHM